MAEVELLQEIEISLTAMVIELQTISEQLKVLINLIGNCKEDENGR